jgi:hypothetical protein
VFIEGALSSLIHLRGNAELGRSLARKTELFDPKHLEGSFVNALATHARRWPKWTLFAALLLTVPVPYFMVVVGGIVPTFYIIYIAVHGLIVALPKFTAEGFWMLGILWAHVVILGGLLYVAAAGITWLLFSFLPHRYALVIVFGLIVALFVASTLEIYRVPGHNSAPPANIFRIYKGFFT